MQMHSPMTIYDVKKIFSPAAGFHPKEDNAYVQ
jgi:hypothetical protein